MRITGGRACGIPLKTPSGNTTRPATDRLRQAIFSSLGERITNTIILDIFAGTGAYALESLSRGAKKSYCIELAKDPLNCIKINFQAVAKSAQLPENSLEIFKADALTWLPLSPQTFDIIFIDPPYPIWPKVADILLPKVSAWSTPLTHIFMEHPGGQIPSLPQNWYHVKTFGKGKNEPTSSLFFIK